MKSPVFFISIVVAAIVMSDCHYDKGIRNFNALIDGKPWPAMVWLCDGSGTGPYHMEIQERPKGFVIPHGMDITGFYLDVFHKIFTESNIDSLPKVIFDVLEVDAVIDTYHPIPDGRSWLALESIDPETGAITMRFHLHMRVERPGGALNDEFGDTILFSDGLIKTNICGR